jgi:hypothetical protein
MYQEDHGDQVTYELTRLDTDLAENISQLSYFGNCTDDNVIEHIFGDATGFAQAVDAYGDEFTIDDLVVKYDPETDIHSFYYKNNAVTENFADGKGPGRPGDSRRHGIPKHATLAQLDKIAHQGGRKGQLAHWQANMRRGRAKTNEAIAPHGDSWNELNLMKIGEKPAALVGPQEFEKLYKPVMRKYNWIWTHITVPNPDSGPLVVGFERYIIGQPGEQARIARMQHLILQMNSNLKNGIKPDADYHIEMGRLLGYSDTDIAEFLKKINM